MGKKISALEADSAPDPADLIVVADVSASTSDKVTVAELAASSAFAGQYAPLQVDQFVDPFPAFFGGGTVNESIADVVNHVDAYVGTGTGSPLGVVTGNVGDRYIDTAATMGARVWYKASGTATNTGWLVAEGDTGWRDVESLLNTTDLVVDALFLRRVNNRCLIRYSAIGAAVAINSKTMFAAGLPTSFTVATRDPLYFGYGFLQREASSFKSVFVTSAGGTNITFSFATWSGTSAAGDRYTGGFQYETTDAWPTSLPGTAA